ncbi:MAG TPA: DUF2203 domain-containing protein [Tepidisphaeraceae bacterium]
MKEHFMAASKSWSSGAAPTRTKRHFTLAEANRTLPLVSRVVSDITRLHEQATQLHAKLEERNNPQQRADVERAMEQTVDRLSDLVAELKAIGCDIRDYRIGLVDFIGRHEGREICLCWKLGEPSIGFWHELNAGFSGRQPISVLSEQK